MTVGTELRVRVWVTDVWDTAELTLSPETTVSELKAAALKATTGRTLDPAEYEVKYRGGVVSDETQTLAQLGVPDGAPLIVLPARRQPVR